MNIPHLIESVHSAHRYVVNRALSYHHGHCEWGEVASAIAAEGDAIRRLADTVPHEADPPDVEQAREDARMAQWANH